MDVKKNKGILKIIDEIKNKTLSKEEIIEKLKEIGEKGTKSLAEELIPLFDEFESENVKYQLRETLAKLGINGDYLNGEGIKREDNDDFDGAIKMYELCVKLDPYHQWSWYNLGRMYGDKKRNNEKAIEIYKKAINVNENYGDAWNNLGNIYSRIQQLSLAKDAYENSIKSVGYKSKHYPNYNLGLLYEKLGDNQKSLEFYLKAVKIKPDYAKALFYCGKTYKLIGNPEKSWEYFALSIKYDRTYEKDIRELGVNVEEVMAMQILKHLDKFEPVQVNLKKKVKKSKSKIHGTK